MPLWGKIDNDASKPKYLSDTLRNDQTVTDKDATAGIDRAEAVEAVNRAKAIKTPGWTKYRTYVDAQGVTRHKAEILVAFGGDFDGGDSDAFPPTTITITEQPQDQTVVEGETASFSVDYQPITGVTFSIQWQQYDAEEEDWDNLSGATDFDLVLTERDLGDDGTQYRAVITANGSTATSDVATLTVTAVEPE